MIITIAVVLITLALGYLYYTGALKKYLPKKEFKLEEYQYTDTVIYSPKEYVPNLVLVNNEWGIDRDYDSQLEYYRDTDVLMNKYAIEPYGQLSDYIKENLNDKMFVSSTYRSYEDQERVLGEEGEEVAAKPGHSEHQTGLAMDVYVKYHAGMGFIDSEVGKYVNSHCGEYGFIIRYPQGRKDVTGFDYEPWHIRYVGHPHSDIIMSNDLTLEEYLGSFEWSKWYQYGDYIISLQKKSLFEIPAEIADKEIFCSDDNRGDIICWCKIK